MLTDPEICRHLMKIGTCKARMRRCRKGGRRWWCHGNAYVRWAKRLARRNQCRLVTLSQDGRRWLDVATG